MATPQTTSTHGILGPSGHHHFTLTRRAPASDLSEYVERHWVVEWDLAPGESFTQELLPHPCVNLVTESTGAAVHGIPSSRSRHHLEGRGMAVGTKFRPGAFAALSGQPGRRLVDRALSLPALFGEEGALLERRLTDGAGDRAAHVSAVEDFLRLRLPPPDPRFKVLTGVVADMLVADRAFGVAALATRHAISQSTLQRLFRDYIGVTPKWVLKRYRVHEAAERIAAGEGSDAARLAADLGYFDQPHFIRDFTAQVGCSPGRYARACAAARSSATPAREAA